jgi:glycosyltransferase involved in cell wall biosynthesis
VKISIITPCYNSVHTIKSTILSVLCQNYDDIEHIIIDAESTDGTIDLIHEINSPIVTLVSEGDNGLYEAINKGIDLSTGEIIGILNSDDKFSSHDILCDIKSIFQNNNDVDCIYGNVNYVNSNGKLKRKWRSKEFKSGLFQKSWTPAHPTFYCRRQVYNVHGKYKLDYKIAADVDFMMRVLEVNKVRSRFLNKVMVDMTIGGISNRGFKSTYIICKEIIKSFKENGLKFSLLSYLLHKFFKLKELI